jgi:Tfp pilus assembly protein FimT
LLSLDAVGMVTQTIRRAELLRFRDTASRLRLLQMSQDSHGFGLAEFVTVVAVVGVLTAASLPMFLTYWQSATLKAGAQELAATLNRGRELAVARNTTVCVGQAGNQVRFLLGGCGGVAWIGPGTDANGWMNLVNDVKVTGTTANVVFTYLGAANVAGTYTVQNPANNRTMSVTVALTGRVTIGP